MKINEGAPQFDDDLPENVKQSMMHITTGEHRAAQYMWAHACEAASTLGLSMFQMLAALETCKSMLLEPMNAALKSELPDPKNAIKMYWPDGKRVKPKKDDDEPESYFD